MKLLATTLVLALTGCASSGSVTSSDSSYNSSTLVRNTSGQTVARIQDGNVYKTDGTRVARIDSLGNIYSTTGPNAGQRIGKISK